MITPTRDQLIALAALFVIIAACVIAPALAFSARSDAMQGLSDENELLTRLIAAQRRAGGKAGDRAEPTSAPAAAFLSAQTPGLATAQLEAYLADLVGASHASLVSSSAQQADRSDTPDMVRIQASMDIDYEALQTLLYKLEAGAPYVFVDSLTLRPATAASKRSAQESPMKAVLGLRALWRQHTT